MAEPLFSIIIPSYSAAGKIAATIESVLSQKTGLAEVVVVDGASKDGTVDILKGYGEKIRWISEPDKGVYDAMNKGIAMAEGRYINFQGAGDVLRPGVLEALAPHMPDRPLAMVYGRIFHVAEEREDGEPFTRFHLRNANLPHQAVFYEKGISDEVGLYDLAYPTCADYAYNILCFANPKIERTYVDLVVSNYEGGGMSVTNTDTFAEKERGRYLRKYLGWDVWLLYNLQKLVPAGMRRSRLRWMQRLGLRSREKPT